MRKPAATRWPTTVGPVQPGEGCTATPTGLSITTMESSSWMIRIPSTISGFDLERVGLGWGSTTSSMLPGLHAMALDHLDAVDLHVAGGHQLGRPAAREPEHPGHRRVDPLAGQPLGDEDDAVVDGAGHDAGLLGRRVRAVGSVARRR